MEKWAFLFLFLLVHPLFWKIKYSYSVFAYDHTITSDAIRGNNIKFFKTGLGIGPNLKRLKTIIEENDHINDVIEYLKVRRKYHTLGNLIFLLKIDIEWAEFQSGGFSDWFSSGVLENVNQLGNKISSKSLSSNPIFQP